MDTTNRAELTPLMQIAHQPWRYQFIQLMRLLDSWKELNNFQLMPHSGLGFPAADVQNFDSLQKRITFNFMGLCGVDAPLPLYMLLEASRLTESANVLRDFLNIFDHRLYQLFYQAWKRNQPAVFFEQNNEKFLHYLIALSGNTLGLIDKKEFAATGLLGRRGHSANALAAILREFLIDYHASGENTVSVTIDQFILRWIDLPNNSQLGKELYLGETGLLGNRVLDASSQILITISTLSLSRAITLLPHQAEGKRLRHFINRYLSPHHCYKICLIVKLDGATALILGQAQCLLGWKSWLGELSTDTKNIVTIIC
jgi:type VI secretion system protein ImpH